MASCQQYNTRVRFFSTLLSSPSSRRILALFVSSAYKYAPSGFIEARQLGPLSSFRIVRVLVRQLRPTSRSLVRLCVSPPMFALVNARLRRCPALRTSSVPHACSISSRTRSLPLPKPSRIELTRRPPIYVTVSLVLFSIPPIFSGLTRRPFVFA